MEQMFLTQFLLRYYDRYEYEAETGEICWKLELEAVAEIFR